MDADTELTNAEIGVTRTLLLEICEALVARGSLTGDEIAGALLRTEFWAEIADRVAEEDGDITRPHAGLAKETTEKWRHRFGNEPSIYVLRKRHTDWLMSGQLAPSPLDPDQVLEWSRLDDA